MVEIKWCLKAKNGLELVEPNSNLSTAYLKKAEDSLKSIDMNKVKEWKITTAYYASYFSLYAILMKLGIKCEIHSCTIEFAKQFLNTFFKSEDLDFLEESFKTRIDTQYYVNRDVPDKKYSDMLKGTPAFHIKCKQILNKLTEKDVNRIRDILQKMN